MNLDIKYTYYIKIHGNYVKLYYTDEWYCIDILPNNKILTYKWKPTYNWPRLKQQEFEERFKQLLLEQL